MAYEKLIYLSVARSVPKSMNNTCGNVVVVGVYLVVYPCDARQEIGQINLCRL